jgi:hypothetical protein
MRSVPYGSIVYEGTVPNSSSKLTYGLGPRSTTRSFKTSKLSTGRVVKHITSLSFVEPAFHDDLASLGFLHRSTSFALFGSHRAIDRTRESHAEVDSDAGVDDSVHDVLMVSEVEVGKEAERPEGERKDRGYNILE